MTKEKKYSLLSLLIIPGLLLAGLINIYPILTLIGWMMSGIGGFYFGRLLSITLKK